MNLKKSTTLIIIIILIITITSYFIFSTNKDPSTQTESTENNNNNNAEESIMSNTKEQCASMSEDTIDNAFKKWGCYTDIAESEMNIEICDLIPLESEEGSKYLNRYTCYRIVGIATNDSSVCEKIPTRIDGAPFGGRALCNREISS